MVLFILNLIKKVKELTFPEMNGKNIYYLATVNKSEDAFWLIQFICSEKNKDKYKPKFLEWSKTVSFDKTSN